MAGFRLRLISGEGPVVFYLLLTVALAVVAYLPPVPVLPVRALIGVASVVAVLAGTVRYRPPRPLAWLLLAGSLLGMTAGDLTHVLLAPPVGAVPFPSVADLVYLCGFLPLAIAGILLLSRATDISSDRANLVDALIISAGLALLAWSFLVQPWLAQETLTFLERVLVVGYPVGGALVLIATARLAIAARWSPSVALLVAGAVGLIAADIAFGWAQLRGGWTVGGWADIGWFAFYAAWGAAALHPSMANLTRPQPTTAGELSPRRLRILSVGAVVALVVLVVEAAQGALVNTAVAVVLALAMILLVLSRLFTAVAVQRRGAARERGLRQAGTALVSAASVEEVRAAVQDAVHRLLPQGQPHRVVLSWDTPAVPPPHGSGVRTAVPARFVQVDELPPALGAQLQPARVALSSPLSAGERTQPGALYVAAAEQVLVTVAASVAVLATQAALALERIRLTEKINRHATERYFRALVQNAADVILILDQDDTIRYATPSAASVLGDDDLAGRTVQELVDDVDRAAVNRLLRGLRRGAGRHGLTSDWRMRAGDRHIEVEAHGRDLRSDPTVAGLVITLRDVTERRRLERELTYRAYHDALTGLANRELFARRVTQALQRTPPGQVVGVLFLDLDDLKLINDTMGHAAGDEVLVAAARRLSMMVGSRDLAARLGGDEFAVLIGAAGGPPAVEQAAARIVAAFEEPFSLGGQLVKAAASVGVATSAQAHTTSELLRQADLALYLAKGAGKAQWRRYEAAHHHQAFTKMQLRSALSRAVAEEQFRLEYQPIVMLDTGQTVGMEALIRWDHPTRGVVGPAEFIEEAEDSGLIVPIGAWVLDRALRDAAGWSCGVGHPGAPYLAVNVSARQLRQQDFLPAVRAMLTSAGVGPECLVMEITERVLLRDDEQDQRVWQDLAALRELGIRVAIDDFGTGYSSLSYLRQAPLDFLKIERSFLRSITTSRSQLAVVDGIVKLAHTLDLEVIAEGIEQPQDRYLLQRIGCRYGQGYLFARPMPPQQVHQWLQPPVAGLGGRRGRATHDWRSSG